MKELPVYADLVFETSEFSKASRLEKWRSSMSEAYYSLEILEDDSQDLDAKIEVVILSDVNISKFRSTRAQGFRSRSDIGRDTVEFFVFVFVTEGEMYFNQMTRCGTLSAGQYVMLRSGEPYELSCNRPSKAITLHLPVSDVEDRYQLAHLHCAKAFESDPILFPMMASVMRSIGAVPTSARELLCRDLRRQVMELILLLLRTERLQANIEGSASFEGLLVRLIGYIEQNYMNADLSARIAANELGISVSHLHRVFSNYNMTFGSTLRNMRLARSYDILSSSEAMGCNVSEVAFKVGFLDHSHFSRSFKATYGLSPSEAHVSFEQQE